MNLIFFLCYRADAWVKNLHLIIPQLRCTLPSLNFAVTSLQILSCLMFTLFTYEKGNKKNLVFFFICFCLNLENDIEFDVFT